MQTNLFNEIENKGISVEQASKIANVSTATIRNWIRTSYLRRTGKGLIDKDSLDYFMTNVAGKEKLNSRANKLQKDEHNHEKVTYNINSLLQNFRGEKIGIEYENSLSDSFRNKEGIYYTPSWVVADMFKGIPINSDVKFLDPCCGSGNFIIQAIKSGVSPENVYGFDVDENAVLITKQRIKDEIGFESENIQVGDFLNEALVLKKENILFDLIFTNPPWGKKIDKIEKQKFATLYQCGNSLDTTSLFMGASLSLLKQEGFLGFLIQEAFFNITTFEDIRRRVISKQILRLVDYDKAFKGLVTKAQSIIIANNKPKSDTLLIECSSNSKTYSRSLISFKNNPKSIFNFWTNQHEAKVIDQLYKLNHITLQGKAKWALGIVTGNNKKYCKKTKEKDSYIPIYKGSDITKSGMKEASNFIPNDFSNFQQVAPIEMYQANEKLIYKFISSDLCFFYDNQQRFILNSANLLIPLNIGISVKQLTELLNSEILNWLFKKLFSTHKVLRGDLELLPIHIEYFKKHEKFSEETYLEYLQIMKSENGTFRIKS